MRAGQESNAEGGEAMSFPGRKSVSFPWGKIALVALVLLVVGYAIVGAVKSSMNDKEAYRRYKKQESTSGSPGVARRGADRVEDNVKQIFFGNPFENPKARVYTPPVQFPMSSSRGAYYKDR